MKLRNWILFLLVTLALLPAGLHNPGQAWAAGGYYATGLTGGTGTDLDGTDGAALADGDLALVADGTDIYFYRLDATSGAAESVPDIISPDTNAGDKRWILQNVYSVTSGINPPAGVEITGNIAGMVLSNDTDADHDINVTAGACMDSSGIYHILASSEMTKQLDAPWAAGNDQGGLLNGSISDNELYHIYALRKDADGTADYGFLDQDDAIGDHLPAGYSAYRWIGFVVTDGSANIRGFVHLPDDFIVYNAAYEILTDINSGSLTAQDISGHVPTGRTALVRVGANDNNAGSTYISGNPVEAEFLLTPASGTVWASIMNVVSPSVVDVGVNGGSIYMISTVTADLWLKAVKFIR